MHNHFISLFPSCQVVLRSFMTSYSTQDSEDSVNELLSAMPLTGTGPGSTLLLKSVMKCSRLKYDAINPHRTLNFYWIFQNSAIYSVLLFIPVKDTPIPSILLDIKSLDMVEA
jgi:hypothetical protein